MSDEADDATTIGYRVEGHLDVWGEDVGLDGEVSVDWLGEDEVLLAIEGAAEEIDTVRASATLAPEAAKAVAEELVAAATAFDDSEVTVDE